MLALLLGILKVIFYIILSIIVLLLSLLMIILFVPIRYQVEGEKYNAIKLDVRVSWLLHIISFKYHMEDSPTMSLKVFGKTVMGDQKEKKTKSKKTRKTKEKIDIKEDKKMPIKEDEERAEVQTVEEITEVKKRTINDDSVSNKKEEHIEETTKTIKVQKEEIKEATQSIKTEKIETKEERIVTEEEKDNAKKVKKIKKVKKESKKIKKSNTSKKEKNKINKNTGKWKQIYNTIKDFLKNDDNKAVLKMVKDKLLKMIKHILPNKFHSKVIIGTGDPASTGYVVGAVSILYTVTGNKLKVVPNFEEQIFEGCFYGKGRIYLIVLLKNTLRIILDKRVRKLYKTYRT